METEMIQKQVTDKTHINIYNDQDMNYWTGTFDVCKEALLRAVEKAGTLVKEVEEILERNRKLH